jgi:hypothetical protein
LRCPSASVAAEAGRLLDYFRAHGAARRGPAQRPLVQALVGILRTSRGLLDRGTDALQVDGEAQRVQLLGQMAKHFEAALVLGEKPEGATP